MAAQLLDHAPVLTCPACAAAFAGRPGDDCPRCGAQVGERAGLPWQARREKGYTMVGAWVATVRRVLVTFGVEDPVIPPGEEAGKTPSRRLSETT